MCVFIYIFALFICQNVSDTKIDIICDDFFLQIKRGRKYFNVWLDKKKFFRGIKKRKHE